MVVVVVTCTLTAKNRDQLRNPTLRDRVWATFTFYHARTHARTEGRTGLKRNAADHPIGRAEGICSVL